MTNKPMLSVELRALLERLLSHDFAEECQECGIGYSDAWEDLRALLDKPPAVRHNNVIPDWLKERFGEIEDDAMSLSGCAVFTKMRTKTQAYFDMARCEISPVACVIAFREGVKEPELLSWNQLPVGEHHLYAEQTALVSDQTQCEECKGWGYHENHHEGGGTECGECGGSGNASVAVFMPDVDELAQIIRKVNGSHTLGAGSLAEAILEEVARLNGLKP